MDLSEFLLARIAEDEAVARAASPGPWRIEDDFGVEAKDGRVVTIYEEPRGSVTTTEDTVHIARHDPARVLAECEAKRQIVRDYQHEVRDYRAGYTNVQPGHKTMKHLALPYADHPDFRAEWRPTSG